MPNSPVRLSVETIILNWNGRPFLVDCLAALDAQDYAHVTITMVDNGSTDGSVEWVRKHYPNVKLIENGSNLGFAAGNNVALQNTNADVVALLNPDVNPSPDWIRHLVTTLSSDEQIGIVGSKLWYPDGRTIQHAGGFLRVPQAMPGHFAIGEVDAGQADALQDVQYVIGGAVGIRSKVLRQVGLLDAGFFLYYEDVDYCQRARNAGWRVVYAPSATAVHVESASAIKGSFTYLQNFHTGRWRYLLKHYPGDALVIETVVAEMRWLDVIDPKERLAAALTYYLSLNNWDEIMSARVQDGAGALSATTAVTLREGLEALQSEAWSAPGPQQEAEFLADKAVVTEPAFHSSSSLVATLQTAWTNVAARWYLHPLIEAQNAFNRQLPEHMSSRRDDIEAKFVRLCELQAIHATMQQETRLLAQLNHEAQAKIVQLESRLAMLGLPRD